MELKINISLGEIRAAGAKFFDIFKSEMRLKINISLGGVGVISWFLSPSSDLKNVCPVEEILKKYTARCPTTAKYYT